MQTKTPRNATPQQVQYSGHLYVLADSDDDKEEKEAEKPEEQEDDEEPAEAPMSEEEEEAEEVDLLEALKRHWQTILDKLPDDLDVDEELEEAMSGIEDVISVLEKLEEEEGEEPGEGGFEEGDGVTIPLTFHSGPPEGAETGFEGSMPPVQRGG